MAQTIPEMLKKGATAGERLLFRTLKDYLPEDYIVYYEPDIQGWRPDFVIIGPDLGLVVLEVKDYTRGTLDRVNPDQWRIQASSGEFLSVKSPIKQAREYAFRIANHLKRDVGLQDEEGKHRMQLKFPYGYGAVMTRLSQEQMEVDGLYTVMDPKLVLTRDEIDPNHERFSAILLRQKLHRMFTVSYTMTKRLNSLDIQRIRFHLFPEVRIGARVRKVSEQEQILLSLDDVETMDLHQESLAKQIGDKHRLIRGVAGSGKTLILASRACLLAKEHPDWKILVLCYNISLSRNIRQMIHSKVNQPASLFDFRREEESKPFNKDQELGNIQVYHFHEWLREELKLTEGEIPDIITASHGKQRSLPVYDAILIDEGQDFHPEWLALTSKVLNPKTQSYLIVEDRAQNIYSRKRSYRQDTGLDFRGRSRILTVNYRNTAPIVRFSWDFYKTHSSEKTMVEKTSVEEVEIIAPQSSLRQGPEPEVRRFGSLEEEMGFVGEKIKTLHREEGIPFSEMLILYRVRRFQKNETIGVIQNVLLEQGIPFVWFAKDKHTKRKFDPNERGVKISTIDSSKGLDFQVVFVVEVHRLPFPLEEDRSREVSLLYIAMTRAKKYLFITYSGDSEFTGYFDEVAQVSMKGENDDVFSKGNSTMPYPTR